MSSLATRQLNPREKILFGMIVFVAMIGLNRVFQTKWRSQSAELDHKVSELSLQKLKDQTEYQDLVAKSANVGQNLRSKEMITKIEEENDYFSSFVSKLAHQDNIGSFRILRLATDASVQSAEYVRTPITLTVESSFPGVGKFLESLENSPTLVAIDSMEIYRIENDLKRCAAKIKLSNYVVKR